MIPKIFFSIKSNVIFGLVSYALKMVLLLKTKKPKILNELKISNKHIPSQTINLGIKRHYYFQEHNYTGIRFEIKTFEKIKTCPVKYFSKREER